MRAGQQVRLQPGPTDNACGSYVDIFRRRHIQTQNHGISVETKGTTDCSFVYFFLFSFISFFNHSSAFVWYCTVLFHCSSPLTHRPLGKASCQLRMTYNVWLLWTPTRGAMCWAQNPPENCNIFHSFFF